MSIALGRTQEDEYKENLHEISKVNLKFVYYHKIGNDHLL